MDYILKAWELWYAGDARGKDAIRSSFPTKDALGYSCPDHPGRCSCRFCAGQPEPSAPVDRFSAGYERRSDLVGGFAARLSHAAQAKFPDKRFYWLPYSEYCTPPKDVAFSDNSYFRLCYMMGTSTYLDPVVQKTYRRWTDAWIRAGRGKRIYGYLYTWPDVDDGIRVPFEFPHALKAFYEDHVDRVEGYFLCFQPEPWLHPLSLYCQMRLLWNPAFDVDACAEEMYADLFGPAAKPMKALYGRPTARWESTPASTYGNALTGGPGDYMGPHVTKDECFTRLFPTQDAKATERDLAAIDALTVPADVRERLTYFTEPFRMLVKRRAFWQDGEKTAGKTLHAEPCKAEATPLRLDGVLDEPFWKQAVADDLVCAKFALYTDKPDVPTHVRAVRVDSDDPARRGLAIALEMSEPEMNSRVNVATDNTIYFDDCIELFFDASAKDGQKSGDYRQYVIASDGRFMMMNIHEGLKIGTFEKDNSFGALKRSDNGWTVELFIPEANLLRGIPAAERAAVKSVKANFCRTRRLKRATGEAYRFVSRWRTDYGDGNGDIKQMGDISLGK